MLAYLRRRPDRLHAAGRAEFQHLVRQIRTGILPFKADVTGGATWGYVWMITGNPAEGPEYFTCYPPPACATVLSCENRTDRPAGLVRWHPVVEACRTVLYNFSADSAKDSARSCWSASTFRAVFFWQRRDALMGRVEANSACPGTTTARSRTAWDVLAAETADFPE